MLMAQHFGCARHVYNWALDKKVRHYKQTGKSLSKRALQDALVASKKADKPWLKEVNSQMLLASLGHLDAAFTNFFQGRARFPCFKKKYAGWQSFQCPQHVKVSFESSSIQLPKIGSVSSRLHREFEGKVKTVTIKRSPSGKYFASILVDDGAESPIPATVEADKTKGIDLGLTDYLIDDRGEKTTNPKHLKHGLERLAIEQKKLARKQTGSANRAKQKYLVARIHEQISNKRSDFIHQITAKLAYKSHETSFAVEDLNVKGMLRNRKLARAISDSGWGLFLRALTYKCDWSGKNVLRIGRFEPSSKLCSECGFKAQKMPLSIRHWQCPDCGANHDRDTNAARNIKQFALADALGWSVCVKSSPASIPFCDGGAAKDSDSALDGSQEAPTKTLRV